MKTTPAQSVEPAKEGLLGISYPKAPLIKYDDTLVADFLAAHGARGVVGWVQFGAREEASK